MPQEPERALSVLGTLDLEVDGTAARLTADGSHLVLHLEQPSVAQHASGMSASQVGRWADRARAHGLRFDVVGPHGVVLTAGAEVRSSFGHLLTGSSAVRPGSIRVALPLLRARVGATVRGTGPRRMVLHGSVPRGLLAGLGGTALMLASYEVERRLRHRDGPLDPDDGGAPGVAARRVLHLESLSADDAHRLGLVVRWGYGSLAALPLVPLVDRIGPVRAGAVFAGGVSIMALVLLPLIARTPPPWRWPVDVLLTSVVQHAVYAVGATAVTAAVRSLDADTVGSRA